MKNNTYTVDQIREWLEGWRCFDGTGTPVPGLSVDAILTLLDCDQDGIEAYFKRNTHTP